MAAKKGFSIGKEKSDIGKISFLGGFTIAIIAGIVVAALGTKILGEYAKYITLLLVVLGILVGLLNITKQETTEFLVAAVVLALGTTMYDYFLTIPVAGAYIVAIFANISAFVIPAAAIVALVAVYNMAKR